MTLSVSLNSDAVRDAFRAWNADRDSLDAELNESFAALSAYQLHLDVWQQQLARERDELRAERQHIEQERGAAEKCQSEASAAVVTELNAAREKITALTTLLLNRTEELRTLDNRRAEVQTELELARARERELKAALDEHKSAAEQERSQWAEELRQLREVLERQLDAAPCSEPADVVDRAPPTTDRSAPAVQTQSPAGGARVIPRENPLVGSIVEQFGKLRQQRAVERQVQNKPR